jgi:hypothetical protein
MGFRNPLTVDSDARAAAAAAAAAAQNAADAATAAQNAANGKVDRLTDEMGGESLQLRTTSGGFLATVQAGTEDFGPVVRVLSPPNTTGVRSGLVLGGTETGGAFGDTGATLSSTGAIDLRSASGSPVRVNGADLVVARQRVWSSSRAGNASDPIGTASTTCVAVTINNAPAGDWLLTFRCVISNAAVAAGNMALTVNSVSVGDGSPRADCGTAGIRFPFSETWGYTHAGGAMTMRGVYQAAATTGSAATVWSQGTYITATYLGPR